jgi:hypothetical protein
MGVVFLLTMKAAAPATMTPRMMSQAQRQMSAT